MRDAKLSAVGLPLAIVAATSLFVGCKKEQQASDASGFPRSQTLYLAGSQWGDPSTFNPLAEGWQSAWPVRDRFNLMYEAVLNYNMLTGELEPCLGALVAKNNDSVVIDLNSTAKWSDGKPVTSDDVKFIFELGRKYKSAATSYTIDFIAGINVDTIDNAGTKTERLSFLVNKKGRNNPLVVLDLLQSIRIVPSHVFQDLLAKSGDNLDSVKKLKIDQNPVVSGPYNLKTYSNEKIVLERRDDYWGNAALHEGKQPAPKYIIHPIYKSNDHFAIALQKGDLDASMTYIPRIWMKKKDNVGTWMEKAPYFMPGAIPMLILNCEKAPLNDKVFRRAMAAAINYGDVKELAVSGYSPDIQPGLIMPSGLEGRFFDAAEVKKHAVESGVEAAKSMLAAAGYKSVYKADGTLDYMTDKTGKRLPTLSIKSPAGWSDWEAMVTIAVKSLRSAGIDVREGFVDASLYWPAKPSGDFDILMDKPASNSTPALPWSRFDAVMSSRNWAPLGGDNKMNENQGRYNNPKGKLYNAKVDSLINTIPLVNDSTKLKAAYVELNNIFLDDQPAIPLVNLPEQFYEFSSTVWNNWPTEANPYAPPQLPHVSAGTKILWQLKLAD